jgi:hypothetical protein
MDGWMVVVRIADVITVVIIIVIVITSVIEI